jgi:hypothetical protein
MPRESWSGNIGFCVCISIELTFESLIVSDFFASEVEEVLLEAQFHKLSAEKAFCNLDLNEMLGEDGWVQFIAEELWG